MGTHMNHSGVFWVCLLAVLVGHSGSQASSQGSGRAHLHSHWRTVPVSDKVVIEAAAAGLQQYNARSNSSLYALQVQRIVWVNQYKTPRFIKYTIMALAGLSRCKNDGKTHTLAACPVVGELQYHTFGVLYHHHWSPTNPNRFKLLWHSPSIHPHSHNSTRHNTSHIQSTNKSDHSRSQASSQGSGRAHLHSHWRTVPVSDKVVIEAAAAGLQQFNARSNSSLYALQVQRIVWVNQYKTPRFIKYTIMALAGLSRCKNDGKTHTLAACPVVGELER